MRVEMVVFVNDFWAIRGYEISGKGMGFIGFTELWVEGGRVFEMKPWPEREFVVEIKDKRIRMKVGREALYDLIYDVRVRMGEEEMSLYRPLVGRATVRGGTKIELFWGDDKRVVEIVENGCCVAMRVPVMFSADDVEMVTTDGEMLVKRIYLLKPEELKRCVEMNSCMEEGKGVGIYRAIYYKIKGGLR